MIIKQKFICLLIWLFICSAASAQGGYTISKYNVNIVVNKDASLDVDETITANFTEDRHGIIRKIPFKYPLEALPSGMEKADRQLESNGETKTILQDIKVQDWDYDVSTEGDYKSIKIGNKNKYVNGEQVYQIHYKVLNAINFFKDKSEFYFNVIGDQWDTQIDQVTFSIELYSALQNEPDYFIATGSRGSKENNTVAKWSANKNLSGSTTRGLMYHEGLTIGIVFPDQYLVKPNYFLWNFKWMILPAIVLLLMYIVWSKWGKDEKITLQTEFYPPKGLSPSVAGYVIDDKLDKRDLTALVPYWGAGGYLQIKEVEKKSLAGLLRSTDYEFIKLKELSGDAMIFERTLFDGIFASGSHVMLSSLKNVLYTSMTKAKSQLEQEVDKGDYYVKGSRGMGCFFNVLGAAITIYGIVHLFKYWGDPFWDSVALILSGIIILAFGIYMPKKTDKGTDLYRQLAGFKEFIQMVEQPRLEQFLKDDPGYFDKVLPYAIVFDVADKWKDKLKGLDVPPPNWYSGNYSNFTTYMFLSSLDHSMNKMTENFYSAPSSSGSSGGSWSGGGGGFSGGGFGGGGGSSW